MVPRLNAVRCELLKTISVNINNNDIECSFEIDTRQFTISKLEKLLNIITCGFRNNDLYIMFYFNDDYSEYCDKINIFSKSLENDICSDISDIDIFIRKFRIICTKKHYDVWCKNNTYTISCRLEHISTLLNVFDKK